MSRVTVDAGRCLGKLDRNVFGGFVEHLGRCINGGLFEEGSPLSDSRGFRTDVVELLRPLRLSVLRWPGGNFVSNYLWTDGIGPRDARPPRLDLAWGAVEPNRFGTDEFLQYCAELGASSLHLPQHGYGGPLRGSGLGRVLQLVRPQLLGRPSPPERPRGRLRGPLLGAGQRDVRGLAGRPDVGGRVRKGGDEMGQGHTSLGPRRQTGELRPQRLGRLGPRRHRRHGLPGRPALAAHLHRCGGLLGQRPEPPPGGKGDKPHQ